MANKTVKLRGTVEEEITGRGGTYQIRKEGGTVEYLADRGTVYHPVTYTIVKQTGRGRGRVLQTETPGRSSRAWLVTAREYLARLAEGEDNITPRPVTDANPYDVISQEIRPTLAVISASKALLDAMHEAEITDPEFEDCVAKGLERLRLKLADQLVERTSGGWFSAR